MKLEFNREQLLELMQDFYTLSGIRIVLFDDEYRELLAYPAQPCRFCSLLKFSPVTERLCSVSDVGAFREAEKEKRLILFRCHAGLIEAAMPLIDNHVTIGYLMCGHIAERGDTASLEQLLRQTLARYGISCTDDITQGISRKTDAEIRAAVKIMEACTHYALLSQAVSLKRQQFDRRLRAYLLGHLNEPMQSQDIAQALGISRSKLYQQCTQYLGVGIGAYLKQLRLERAQELLRTTNAGAADIAAEVGFADYGYFCRVFRQRTGMSPGQYRRRSADE